VATAIRIVVGEGDYLAREGVVRALETVSGVEVMAICSNLGSLRAAIELEKPDLALMSLRLPPAGADKVIELIDELADHAPEIGVVVLGDCSDSELALPLFERPTAARSFILRDQIHNSAELTRVLREVARGGSVVDPAAVGTLLTAVRRRSEPSLGMLTEREREVLGLVAKAKANGAIARELGITTRAVERHLNAIFRKLELAESRDVNRRVKVALAFADDRDADDPPWSHRRRSPTQHARRAGSSH
jgi:DNA-binding NarL/FixJ family response regulator